MPTPARRRRCRTALAVVVSAAWLGLAVVAEAADAVDGRASAGPEAEGDVGAATATPDPAPAPGRAEAEAIEEEAPSPAPAVDDGDGAGPEAEGATEEPGPEVMEEEAYDPWAGIDRNGRIPRVPLPSDIEHPERWRYIPEGRIKPGNIFQRFLVSSFIAPFVFNNQDVGTGFGIGFTDIDFRHQRRREFAGIFLSYTTRGQQQYGIAWRRMLKTRDLPTGGVIQEERSFVIARASYSKTLTRRFFGFGPDTIPQQQSSYLDEAIEFALGIAYSLPKPFDDFVAEARIDAEAHQLGSGTVQGAFDMRFLYPETFRAFQDWNFGNLGVELRWDTRDSQRNPYEGHALGARVDALLAQTGGNVGAVFTLFGSKVFRVPGLFHDGGDPFEAHPPTDTIAVGMFTQASTGTVPFYLLPTLGGRDTLRGYIAGRWRDRAAWHGSVEYRFWVIPRGIPVTRNVRIERIGLAAFYDVGAVSPTWPDIFSSTVSQSYGFGLRVGLERAAVFRLDFGFSPEDFNFIAAFGIPF
jgi:hypothetical protein